MSPFPTIEVAVEEAIPTFERHLEQYSSTGRYPIVIGDTDDLRQFQQSIKPPRDGGSAILEKAASLKPQDWFRSRRAKPPKAVAKGVPPQSGWATLTNLLTGELKPRLHLGLIEASEPSHVFASLGFGDWNDCPPPQVHVALHRYWHQRFGSILVALSTDVAEYYVPSPPTSDADVLALAAEQHAYCKDIVEQGYGTKAKLAASLVAANTWSFWWD